MYVSQKRMCLGRAVSRTKFVWETSVGTTLAAFKMFEIVLSGKKKKRIEDLSVTGPYSGTTLAICLKGLTM